MAQGKIEVGKFDDIHENRNSEIENGMLEKTKNMLHETASNTISQLAQK